MGYSHVFSSNAFMRSGPFENPSPLVCKLGIWLLARSPGFKAFDKAYDTAMKGLERHFNSSVFLQSLGFRPRAPAEQKALGTGPLLVVSNHPLGLADGLQLFLEYSTLYPGRVKMLGNRAAFHAMPLFGEEAIIPVDISNSDPTLRRAYNKEQLKKCHEWLAHGNILIVFPSGTIARRRHLWDRKSKELPWRPGVLSLAQAANYKIQFVKIHTCLPRFFDVLDRALPSLTLSMVPVFTGWAAKKKIEMTVSKIIQVQPESTLSDLEQLYQKQFSSLRTATHAKHREEFHHDGSTPLQLAYLDEQ